MKENKLVRVRSLIAMISVFGVIAIAYRQPEYASEALAILSLVLGNYFGGLPKRKAEATEE